MTRALTLVLMAGAALAPSLAEAARPAPLSTRSRASGSVTPACSARPSCIRPTRA